MRTGNGRVQDLVINGTSTTYQLDLALHYLNSRRKTYHFSSTDVESAWGLTELHGYNHYSARFQKKNDGPAVFVVPCMTTYNGNSEVSCPLRGLNAVLLGIWRTTCNKPLDWPVVYIPNDTKSIILKREAAVIFWNTRVCRPSIPFDECAAKLAWHTMRHESCLNFDPARGIPKSTRDPIRFLAQRKNDAELVKESEGQIEINEEVTVLRRSARCREPPVQLKSKFGSNVAVEKVGNPRKNIATPSNRGKSKSKASTNDIDRLVSNCPVSSKVNARARRDVVAQKVDDDIPNPAGVPKKNKKNLNFDQAASQQAVQTPAASFKVDAPPPASSMEQNKSSAIAAAVEDKCLSRGNDGNHRNHKGPECILQEDNDADHDDSDKSSSSTDDDSDVASKRSRRALKKAKKAKKAKRGRDHEREESERCDDDRPKKAKRSCGEEAELMTELKDLLRENNELRRRCDGGIQDSYGDRCQPRALDLKTRLQTVLREHNDRWRREDGTSRLRDREDSEEDRTYLRREWQERREARLSQEKHNAELSGMLRNILGSMK